MGGRDTRKTLNGVATGDIDEAKPIRLTPESPGARGTGNHSTKGTDQ